VHLKGCEKRGWLPCLEQDERLSLSTSGSGPSRLQRIVAAPHEHKQKGAVMPKMKTKSSAKKRFRVRPGGTVKRGQAFKRHILTKKTTKNKRQLRGSVAVHETNMGHMAQMLPGMGI
jgi:large subunit ribosomal protein L35